MILQIIFYIFYCQGKLVIDSRSDYLKKQELNQLDQEFSIWFTYHSSADQQINYIFRIMNQDQTLISLWAQEYKLFASFNQSQVIQIKDQLKVAPNEWFHIIVNQTQLIENGQLIFNFTIPWIKQYSIEIDNNIISNDLSIISVDFNMLSFCLIYNNVTHQIEPIFKSSNMQQLISPINLYLYQYQQDSYLEVFLQRFQGQFTNPKQLVSIKQKSSNLFNIIEINQQLEIYSKTQTFKYDDYQIKWIRIFIKFGLNEIQMEIQFLDQTIQLSSETFTDQNIFYDVCLDSYKSNFQFVKFTQYFKIKNIELFNFQKIQSLNNCSIGINNFFDFDSNDCLDKIYFNEIKLIQNDIQQFDISQLLQFNNDLHYIGLIILDQLLSNISEYEKVPFLEQYESDKFDLKEPLILWKYQNYIFCNKYYFGKQCTKFIKGCLHAKNQSCINCQDGYFLKQTRCLKCSLNCLICELIKYKYICLLPQENYYINKFNLIRFCGCSYCNQFGQCVVDQEIDNQNNLCFEDNNCILKNCSNNFQYFSLESQKCIQLQYFNKFQLFYYFSYLDKQYYQLNKIQFIILQNFYIYEDQILKNQRLSNYYLIVQLIHDYNQYFKRKPFNNFQFFIQNKYNLECVSLKLNQFGEFECRQYVNKQNNKCYKQPCIYDLEIRDITYYIGVKSYVEYNNFQYESMLDLMQSIKQVDIEFDKIILEINLICQPNIDDQFDWMEILDFKDENSYSDTFIEIDLKFSSKLNSAHNNIKLNIVADKINLQNEFLVFKLCLHLQINYILIKNIIIDQQGSLKIIGLEEAGLSKLTKILVRGVFQLLLSFQTDVGIQDYKSLAGSLTYFHLDNCDNFTISNSQINAQQIHFPIIATYGIININFINLTTVFQKIQFTNLCQIYSSNNIIISNFTIIGDSVVNNSCLFDFKNINYTKIEKFQSIINIIISSLIFQLLSNFLQIDTFIQSIDQIEFSIFLFAYSTELNVLKFNINSQIIEQSTLIKIDTILLRLDTIQIKQSSSLFQDYYLNNYQVYLIRLSIEESFITKIEITGLQLIDFGLLYIKTKYLINISQLSIRYIECYNKFQNKFIYLQGDKAKSRIIIYGLIVNQITIENQLKATFNLIEVENYAAIQFLNQDISQIVSLNNMSYSLIFQFDCQVVFLDLINVSECINIDFTNIGSQYFMIQNLKYGNNLQQKNIFRLKNGRTSNLIVKNSTFNLQYKEVIFYVEATQNLLILIQDICIYVQIPSNRFIILGHFVVIQLQNIIINQLQNKSEEEPQSFMFEIYWAKLFMRNLDFRNLQQKIFMFQDMQIIMQNILLVNINPRSVPHLIFLEYSQLIATSIYMTSINNSYGLFYIMLENNLILLQDIFIHNNLNVNYIFLLHSSTISKRIIIRDIFISGFTGNQLFCFFFQQLQQLKINNLFINQVDNFKGIGEYSKLQIQNSIIDVKNFFHDKKQLQLINTEIIFNLSLDFNQIQLDSSYFFCNLKSSIIQDISFLITLSFNRFRYLKSIKLHSSNEIQFFVSQDGQQQYYFYVPSGQKLDKYQQLNLQQLSYQQIFQGFYLVIQGFLFGQINYELQCSQIQYYNNLTINQKKFEDIQIKEGFNQIKEQIFIINPHNNNYTVFEILCSSSINDKKIQLSYNVKALPCQLGEYLFQNQCLECNLSQGYYSVTLNSTKCNYIDYSQIKDVKKGLLQVNQKYWRHSYCSDIIEYCDSIYCDGGWIPGDKSCVKSRVGAMCKECDLYNTRGDGYFTNNNQECQLCQGFDLKFVMQFLFTIIWQLLVVLNGYYSNYKLSQQFLMYRVGFRQYYQVLYRQSIDQPNIFLKIFINYIFMLYIIRQNLDLIGQTFISNINIVNNPGLILKAKLDCLMSQVFQLEIIYSQYIYQILLVFLILSLTYTIYFIIIQVKKLRFQIGIILYVTDSILIYNLNIIIDISCNLLSYQLASGQKWIKYNMQYLFYSDNHQTMIKYIIPITVIFFIAPFMFPFAMKNISIFSRLAKRIYAVYHQEFKPQFNFWEYIIIYTKYALLIFQILDSQSNQYGIMIIWLIIIFNSNLKPYYLQNLNQFELNLFIYFGIQLSLILIGDNIDLLIIFLNMGIFIYFTKKFYSSFYILNLNRIIQWKRQIIEQQNWLKMFSGIEKNERLMTNKIMLINLIRTHIMKKQQIQYQNQSRIQTETEIELGIMIKQVQSTIYPSRQEQINI